MKKLMFIFLAGMLMLLAACSDDNDNNDKMSASETSSDETISEEPDESETADDSAEDKSTSGNDESQADTEVDNQSDDDSETGETASDSQLKGFPEYDTLTDKFDVDALESEIATDNPDKRVILYADESGEKQYKSIFIKHDNRLKIISLDEEGQIFNEQLD